MSENAFLPVVALVDGARAPVDLTGRRIGALVVLGLVRRERGGRLGRTHLIWRCVCDCGAVTEKRAANLLSEHTTSCGCQSGGPLPRGEGNFNRLLGRYRREARHRGLAFELTVEQFRALTSASCEYCGTRPAQVAKDKRYGAGEYIYNGVDRVDNTVGYTAQNAVACCRVCNDMKGTLGCEVFLEHVSRIAAHRKAK